MACKIEAAGGCPGLRWPRKKIHPRHGGAASHVRAVQTALLLRRLDQPPRPPLRPSQEVIFCLPSDPQAAQNRIDDLHNLHAFRPVVDGDRPADFAGTVHQRRLAGDLYHASGSCRNAVVQLKRLPVCLAGQTAPAKRTCCRDHILQTCLRLTRKSHQFKQARRRRVDRVGNAQDAVADRGDRSAGSIKPNRHLLIREFHERIRAFRMILAGGSRHPD
ncbi:MAG: hypothetical protein BWY57_02744 [Betaproteobacteria bacterium ADurb.Bin341]|nr:MAG: hypothetical protein BWY57_02744 [Betaproteobacteria bacterium ADurb.Bin341]